MNPGRGLALRSADWCDLGVHPPLRYGRIAAWVAAVLLGVVVVFQLALTFGAPWGSLTQGGANPGVLPVEARAVALVSAVVLVAFAVVLLARTGQGPLAGAPRRLVAVLAWAATVYLGVGLLLNLVTPSAVERAVWAPVIAVLLGCALVVMASTRQRVSREATDRA